MASNKKKFSIVGKEDSEWDEDETMLPFEEKAAEKLQGLPCFEQPHFSLYPNQKTPEAIIDMAEKLGFLPSAQGKVAAGILLEFHNIQKKICLKAAGEVCGKTPRLIPIPPDIFYQNNFALNFRIEPGKNFVYMEFFGGDGEARSKLKIDIYYTAFQEPEVFYVKDRKRGGAWKIPLEKTEKIEKICFYFLEDER